MAWGGGIDAQPMPQFPPTSTTGPCAGSQSWAATPMLMGGQPGAGRILHTPICKSTYMSKSSPARTCGYLHPERCGIGPASAQLWFLITQIYPKTLLSLQKSAGTWRGWGEGGMQGLKMDPSTLQ